MASRDSESIRDPSEYDDSQDRQDGALQEGLHYYIEHGLMVFTEVFLRQRGYCCESGCRHCPYKDSNDRNRER